MANTMTIADKFNAIIEATKDIDLDLDGQSIEEFLNDRIEKAKKKSTSKPKGPSEEQVTLRNEIVRVLGEATEPMSVSEMQKASEIIGECSTSKVTANITPMLVNGKTPNPDGLVVRSMDKKVAKFTLA